MNNKFLILLLLASFCVHADDAGQLVLDAMSDQRADLESSIKGAEADDAGGFYPESVDQSQMINSDVSAKDPFFPGSEEGITQPKDKDLALDRGQRVIGDDSIPRDHLIEANDRQIFKSVARKQKDSFSFYYVRDDYDVTDSRGVYQNTYVNDSSAVRGGSLMISLERTLLNSWINIAWGGNIGVGLSQGHGLFADGQRSDAKFSLWTLPVELGLSLELPVATWFDLAVEGGPAVVGLYQVRSDFESGAAGKRRRQVGTGYYAEAKFKISISNLFRRTAFDYFSQYGVTNTTLDVIARLQDYGNFQDDISISGQSFGIGFTFDYL